MLMLPQATGRLPDARSACERLMDVGGAAKERAKALAREVHSMEQALQQLQHEGEQMQQQEEGLTHTARGLGGGQSSHHFTPQGVIPRSWQATGAGRRQPGAEAGDEGGGEADMVVDASPRPPSVFVAPSAGTPPSASMALATPSLRSPHPDMGQGTAEGDIQAVMEHLTVREGQRRHEASFQLI